jgi:hypothetical protein
MGGFWPYWWRVIVRSAIDANKFASNLGVGPIKVAVAFAIVVIVAMAASTFLGVGIAEKILWALGVAVAAFGLAAFIFVFFIVATPPKLEREMSAQIAAFGGNPATAADIHDVVIDFKKSGEKLQEIHRDNVPQYLFFEWYTPLQRFLEGSLRRHQFDDFVDMCSFENVGSSPTRALENGVCWLHNLSEEEIQIKNGCTLAFVESFAPKK